MFSDLTLSIKSTQARYGITEVVSAGPPTFTSGHETFDDPHASALSPPSTRTHPGPEIGPQEQVKEKPHWLVSTDTLQLQGSRVLKKESKKESGEVGLCDRGGHVSFLTENPSAWRTLFTGNKHAWYVYLPTAVVQQAVNAGALNMPNRG
ncbi:hypothetical protein NXS19_012424 [Fusarium pseudograminearum]|nr:hypothetical protein NXS19_012424 [Fusarium pseudograminearum]